MQAVSRMVLATEGPGWQDCVSTTDRANSHLSRKPEDGQVLVMLTCGGHTSGMTAGRLSGGIDMTAKLCFYSGYGRSLMFHQHSSGMAPE